MASVYDALAKSYLDGLTTTFFRDIQSPHIRKCLARARGDGWEKWYSEMTYLIVGPGPAGNVEEWINQATLRGSYLDEVDPRNITYLDNSAVVLDLCQRHVSAQVRTRMGKSSQGEFVFGSGEEMLCFNEGRFDVVIAALCDHMNTETFFREAYRVLRPGGILITSFPADGLNRVVRVELYNIPPDHTRFNIKGIPHLVPSRLMTPTELVSIYYQHNFGDVETISGSAGKLRVTETIQKAANLIGVAAQFEPLVIIGFGIKLAQTGRA